MRTITPMDLRKSLGAILDEASAGERFLVERDHKPVAMLVSVEDGHRLDEDREARLKRALAAMDRIEARGKRLRESGTIKDGPSAVEMVREDRDRDDV
jgi:antitoxin (DNA-binding transcriptional repressor) of toxin-antitoxin stability system